MTYSRPDDQTRVDAEGRRQRTKHKASFVSDEPKQISTRAALAPAKDQARLPVNDDLVGLRTALDATVTRPLTNSTAGARTGRGEVVSTTAAKVIYVGQTHSVNISTPYTSLAVSCHRGRARLHFVYQTASSNNTAHESSVTSCQWLAVGGIR